jgi:adenylate cyclase
MDQPNFQALHFDRFTLDLPRGCLRAGGQDVGLRPKSFDVLRHLVENAGRLVPKEELMEAVWPNVFVTDDSLVQCVRELREKLGDGEHRLIKTVARRGYLLDTPVTSSPATPPKELTAQPAKVWGWAGAAMAGSGVLIAALFAALLWSAQPRPPASSGVPATPNATPWASLVILPFQNLSGDPEQEYFADGITDDLTSGLSWLPGRVVARNTAFTYKGRQVDVREVARELDVRYVLEGGVDRAGDQVRVTARLIDAPAAANVWTETYEIHRRDLARLREDVSGRLARLFSVELVYAQAARSVRERPQDPTAADHFMRANALFVRSQRGQDLSEVRRLLRLALQADDSIAMAWVALGNTYSRELRFSPTRDADIVEAGAAADRALALDPNAAAAHILKGVVLYESKRMEQALAAFEHAAQLNPHEPWAYACMAAARVMLGRAEHALEPLQKATLLSPKDPALAYWQMVTGAVYVHLARDAEAVDVLTRSVALSPRDLFTHIFLASALARLGRDSEAKNAVAEILRLKPDFTLADFKAREPADSPAFLAQRQRLYEGLRLAGVPE